MDAAQAEDLMRCAQANGVFPMEGMWTRSLPAIRKTVEMVGEGAIGEPRLLIADFSTVLAPGDPQHRVRNPALGGGALLDIGIYPLTISRLVLGAPATVSSAATLTEDGVDDTTLMTLTHPGGALSSLTCSISADGPWTAAVAGPRGALTSPGRSSFHAGSRVARRCI
jgi:predicted dehydrogenase